MSLAILASKLYTVKSRKNLSLGNAFTSLVREDLAMRFSVFNMVKAVTGSDFIATVMQSKYGRLTPIEREELAREKKRASQEKKFKQFTTNSIVNLNNKINTLTALTERNTALILNLYNDLGSFRGMRKDTLSQISNLSAVRTKIKSRTVKYQIDEIRAQIQILNNVTGVKRTRTRTLPGSSTSQLKQQTQTKEKKLSVDYEDTQIAADVSSIRFKGNMVKGVNTYGIKDAQGSVVGTGVEVDISESLGEQILDMMSLPTGRGGRGGRGGRRGGGGKGGRGGTTATRTTTPAPTKPGTATKPGAPIRIGAQRGPGTTLPSVVVKQNLPSSTLPGLIRRLPPGLSKVLFGAGRLVGTGPQTIATIMGGAAYMASGGAAEDVIIEMQERLRPFGIKIIPTKDGTLFEINGITYTSENLPPEYQTILDAFAIDDRSASSRAAQQRIQAAPALYNSLIVEGPPLFDESDTAMRIIAAAKAAQLNIPEPKIIEGGLPEVSAPQTISSEVATSPSISVSRTGESISSSAPAVTDAPVSASAPGIPIDFAAYAKKIGMLESSDNYRAVNSLGYLGKYQFGALALQDLGLVKRGTSLKGLDDPKNWNIEGGKQAFLNNPELQEKSFVKYTTINFKTLQRIGVVTAQSPPDEVAGFLATSHLLGPGGAKDLMLGKVGADAYGTKSSSYYVAGVATQKTYMAASTPPAKLEYASGASVSAPPVIAAAAATERDVSSATSEIQSLAALEVGQNSQQAIAVLASRITNLETKLDQDAPFASVRNSSQVIPGMV